MKKLLVLFIMLLLLMCFISCQKKEHAIEVIDSDTALDYLCALQDYVYVTGDTDIYLYLLEDMEGGYLEEYIAYRYGEEIAGNMSSIFAYGFIEGYTKGCTGIWDGEVDEYMSYDLSCLDEKFGRYRIW